MTFSQNKNSEIQFRQLTGIIVDNTGLPLPGQTIIIKGTTVGVQSDFNGKFCLILPKDEIVFIELIFCFDNIIREINPDIRHIELIVGMKSERKSKKAFRKWKKNQTRFNSLLYLLYNSIEFKTAEENICR